MVHSVRLVIDLESDSDPLSGRATIGNEVESFVGWLALLQVLERAAATAELPPPLGSE